MQWGQCLGNRVGVHFYAFRKFVLHDETFARKTF